MHSLIIHGERDTGAAVVASCGRGVDFFSFFNQYLRNEFGNFFYKFDHFKSHMSVRYDL
jgi:hypothetical protein